MSFTFKYYPYELVPKGRLGNKAQSASRQGALLKVIFSDDKVGYSDCFPWPELGDHSLEEQLRNLKKGHLTELTEQSIVFARADAEARFKGESLFKELKVPKSHALFTDLALLSSEELESLSNSGFTKIKVKVGSHPEKESQKILSLEPHLKKLSIKLRLDFNSSLSMSKLEEFLVRLGPVVKMIDFIEDPIPFNDRAWKELQQKWNIRIALDRMQGIPLEEIKKGSFALLIIKPANQNWKKLVQLAKEMQLPVVVTSYLDHPIGQLYSAWVASQILMNKEVEIEDCGLLSHFAYNVNQFSVLLKDENGCLIPPYETGIGFTKLLSEITWISF